MTDQQPPQYGNYPPLPENSGGTSVTAPASEPVVGFQPTPPAPKKKRTGLVVGAVNHIAAHISGAYIAIHPPAADTTPAAAATTKAPTKLEAVVTKCYPITARTQDLGHTLTLSNVDAKENPGPDDMDTLACVLRGLDTPSSVIDHMSTTRAMDGQQTDSWNGMNARWTYHPDHGMNLTLTDNK